MSDKPNIVAIVGLEHFNKRVWDEVKADLATEANLTQFTEWELEARSPEAAQAFLQEALPWVDLLFLSDEEAVLLSKEIARKIEESMNFPGQIKVTVIRETRAVELANK